MSNILKCPNPSCQYCFDASQVPTGVLMACPQCQRQFRLPGPSQPPVNLPAPGQDELETEVVETPSGRKIVRRTQTQASTGQQGTFLAVFVFLGFVLAAVGGVVVVGFVLGWFNGTTKPVVQGATFEDYAIVIPAMPEGWERSEPTRTALGVSLLAYQRNEPQSWLAIDAKKVEFLANTSELKLRVQERLRRHFAELDEELTETESTLFGKPAQRYEFRGISKDQNIGCKGEVVAIAVNQYLYWVYAWGPQDDYASLAPQWEEARKSLVFTGSNQAIPPPVKRNERNFRDPDGLFKLVDTQELWTAQDEPTLQEANAILHLLGVGRSAATNKPSKERANTIVTSIKLAEDAQKQVLEHILQQYASDATVEEVTGEPDGEAVSAEPLAIPEQIKRLKLTYPGSNGAANKFLVYQWHDTQDKRLVLYSDCSLRERPYWEQRLLLLHLSFQPGR